MKQRKYNKRGMKMLIETGHKTFDKQTNYIGNGNIIANTELSSFIRPKNEIKNGCFEMKYGAGQEFDINQFKTYFHYYLPEYVLNIACKEADERNKSVCLHILFHYNGKQKMIHGAVLTDYDFKLIRSFTFGGIKSEAIIKECSQYICA